MKSHAKGVKLQPLKKWYITGDFDGDRKPDTIFQRYFSRTSRTEIEFAPDPLQNEWDTVVHWFNKRQVELLLTINNNNTHTFSLGTAKGCYCLINIGDNNTDGKDEIAFVIDHLDNSWINSCKVYSLCQDQWSLLKEFAIHEGAFEFYTEEAPTFEDIKGHLEKIKGSWVYNDYLEEVNENSKANKKWRILKIDGCK